MAGARLAAAGKGIGFFLVSIEWKFCSGLGGARAVIFTIRFLVPSFLPFFSWLDAAFGGWAVRKWDCDCGAECCCDSGATAFVTAIVTNCGGAGLLQFLQHFTGGL
jgi:hypothetical protein